MIPDDDGQVERPADPPITQRRGMKSDEVVEEDSGQRPEGETCLPGEAAARTVGDNVTPQPQRERHADETDGGGDRCEARQ